MPQHEDESAGGHYVTAGMTLIALGSLALVISLVATRLVKHELHFIDGRTMGLFGLGFVCIGGWMTRHGGAASQ